MQLIMQNRSVCVEIADRITATIEGLFKQYENYFLENNKRNKN